jgi:anti-sigma factor RsiW
MCGASSTSIISRPDPADERGPLRRASAGPARCERYSKRRVAPEPHAHDAAIESHDDPVGDDGGRNDGSRRHRIARALLHCDWAIALSLAVVIFGGGAMWLGRAPSERAELLEEAAEYHEIYSHETTYLVEVPASKADQLTAWLGERLDREIKVPDLADAGLHFAGGRMLVVNNRPVAELMYIREKGLPIAICVTRIDGKAWPMEVEHHDALRIASWAKDGYAYLVIGEIEEPVARDLARRVERLI